MHYATATQAGGITIYVVKMSGKPYLYKNVHLFMNKKATSLREISSAVQFNEPIGPDHPYYTDFSKVRGDFEEQIIYENLNVHPKTFKYDIESNLQNKVLLFLGGMTGSGKTSEIAKYVKKMHHSECFYCVVCNIDKELDMNDMEYMDILIFQLETLTAQLAKDDIKLAESIIKSLEKWFEERVSEINGSIEGNINIEGGLGIKKDGLWSKLLGIFGGLKMGINGSIDRSIKIRSTFKNHFNDFALKANEFISSVNAVLEKEGRAKEVFFAIDGLEKTNTMEIRRKIILDESNRIKEIKVNTLFTLPIELASERRSIDKFSTVEHFPFVKLTERNGTPIPEAYEKFKEFVYKRIDKSLFDSEKTVEKAIKYGGGAPRELLRILKNASFYADDDIGLITEQNLDKALRKLANPIAQYLTKEDWNQLRIIEENNRTGKETLYSHQIANLIEKVIVLEYNDGTYKRVHPLLELSAAYKQEIG